MYFQKEFGVKAADSGNESPPPVKYRFPAGGEVFLPASVCLSENQISGSQPPGHP